MVRLGNTPLPPGSCTMPMPRARLRRDVGDVAAVEAHDAAFGDLEAADDAQDRRLAGAVRAEQRDALALVDLEVDVEQHLHRAVGEVDVRDLEHRGARALFGALALLRPAPRAAPRRRATGRGGCSGRRSSAGDRR